MNLQLKLAFFERGVRQIEAAIALGMDPARLSKIVNGWVFPTTHERQALSNYLRRGEAELFPGRSASQNEDNSGKSRCDCHHDFEKETASGRSR